MMICVLHETVTEQEF